MTLFGSETSSIYERLARVFNGHSVLVFVISVGVALLVGRFIAFLLRKSVEAIGRRADQSQDLRIVNRLRRYETYLVLSIALIRSVLVILAIYFWWLITHPASQPTAIVGASALAVILLSGVLGPVLRDMAAGSYMMAEQWYGVGDYIKVEPFTDAEGVVERVTLRSTKIRGLNGEVIWLNNQNIWGVRMTPKGTRTLALEMFVDDENAGLKLIDKANRRLPIGPLLVVTPLTVVSNEKVGGKLWQITAIGETAPGREWLLEQSAVELIKWMDEKAAKPVLAHGPLARYADSEAEQSFRRTIANARKRPTPKKQLSVKSVKRRNKEK